MPLDNLDDNIKCADALFTTWPAVDAIIGNPPFQSKNLMPVEFGKAYVEKLRKAYPQMPGRADFCVYWFRRAHDHLKPRCRAGLVGTNTVRQNYSREGGLDYIVQNGGTIVEAVSSQPWSGEAAVHVSIVNWIKGQCNRPKLLMRQVGNDRNGPWEKFELDAINSSLAPDRDVAAAKSLKANEHPKMVFVGQVHHNDNFLMSCEEAAVFLKKHPDHRPVIHPYLTGENLINAGHPTRWIIDFGQRDMLEAMRFKAAFEIVEKRVMPSVLEKAKRERDEVAKEIGPRQNHAKVWWQFWRPRPEVIALLEKLPRYIACSRVTKRPIFEFVSPVIHPNEALIAFTFADDYSFGVLQSGIHWLWFTAKCSTLTERFRYTSDSVFATFPWPQNPNAQQIRAVVETARALRILRRQTMRDNGWSLRELYRTLETPGDNKLRDAHASLDTAVRAAYGMNEDEEILAFLLKLNLQLADKESKGVPITPPGLPATIADPREFISTDCVTCPNAPN